MSDDVSDQTPQGYPPASGGVAPPPPPPPGTFPGVPSPPPVEPSTPAPVGQVPPAATPEQSRKKRGGTVAIIIAIVLLCAIGGCVAAVVGFGVLGGSDDTAAIELAEKHYAAAMDSVEVADGWLKGLESGQAKADDIDAAIADSTKALRAARDELAASRAAIEPVADSKGKAAYLASIEQAALTLDGLEDLLGYMQKATGMATIAKDAGSVAKKASDNLNDAISAGNARKYSKMKDEAKAASAQFAKAAVLFDQAHKIDTSAQLDKAAAYARKRKQQADVVIVMASDGKAGRVSAYNKGITKMNKLGAQAEKIGEPAIVSDPNWLATRVADLNASVEAAATKADSLRAEALEALGYSK